MREATCDMKRRCVQASFMKTVKLRNAYPYWLDSEQSSAKLRLKLTWHATGGRTSAVPSVVAVS